MALFGKRPKKRKEPPIYLLMDSNSRLLARGLRKDSGDENELDIKLIEGDPYTLRDVGIVQTVPQDKSLPPQMARVIACRGGLVSLEPMRELGSEVRRNFRVPVVFDSFVYFRVGGRAELRSVDLSCGGIAFRSTAALAVGSVYQVVVPITSEGPLLLFVQVLRVHLEPTGGNFYACKFVGMIDDEEAMLREAVFAIQIGAVKPKY